MGALVRHDPALAVDQALQRLESLLYEPHGDDTGFDLHSLPMHEFLMGMSVCGQPGRFMDLGCGIGTKMLVALMLGWEVEGVERHDDYAEVARRLLPDSFIDTWDIWRNGMPNLTSFDVVYSYRLMTDLDDQHELNRRIVKRMRPGALYFCAGSEPQGCDEVGHGVWRVS